MLCRRKGGRRRMFSPDRESGQARQMSYNRFRDFCQNPRVVQYTTLYQPGRARLTRPVGNGGARLTSTGSTAGLVIPTTKIDLACSRRPCSANHRATVLFEHQVDFLLSKRGELMAGRPYGTSTLTEQMILKLDPALKAELVQQAEQQQTSLSAVARLVLRAGLAARHTTPQIEVRHGTAD